MRDASSVRWGIAQRFEFIEWKAFWDGRLNRGDLEREFDISTPQASVDLRNYQEAAPGNIHYDSTEKAYVPSPDFRPSFLRLSPERFLLQLHSLRTNAIDVRDTWFDTIPAVDVVPAIARGPEAYTLQPVLKAIRMKGRIQVYYQSLTNTRNRTICPHALAFDGFRWHVRAWCTDRKEYRDFVLGRILSVFKPEPSTEELPDDLAWVSFTKLTLVPHPGLTADQKSVVVRDYRMDGGEVSLTMRVALAYYFVRRYNLDLRNGELAPERALLHLKNYDEYLSEVARIKHETGAAMASGQS